MIKCCYGCNDRTATCHAECERYLREAEEHKKELEKRLKIAKSKADYIAVRKTSPRTVGYFRVKMKK